MQFESVVIRIFDVDFMLFDLLFTAIWIIVLYKKGYIKPLIFGFFGIMINMLIDYGIWYGVQGIRTVEGLPLWMSPFAFFVYFSITYGMIEYSYVQAMFSIDIQKENAMQEMLRWSLFLFGGWLLFGLLSFAIPISDAEVTVQRVMTGQRIYQVYGIIAEYALLAILAYMGKFGLSWKKILYIFSVGFFVHFSMETTLLLSGIRVLDFFNLIFNSVIEFNTGAPILYLLLFAVVPFLEEKMGRGNSP
ncbi:MAG: hypothetical protein ThorAB25_28810 [Candidatus Thorarchaeota archaeon AB_25]|nr:MAG: hypothetical protein ThorAB25_28810 [Candidatus Thorarchaeota archaeon AB_25]